MKKSGSKTLPVKKGPVKKVALTKTAVAAKKRVPRKVIAPETSTTPTWRICASAMQEKKGTNIKVLDLRSVTTFADFFVLGSGSNQRQVQAMADEVEKAMKEAGDPPNAGEGYENGEWVVLDFGDVVAHIFSEKARAYYDLDRLWRDATPVQFVARG